MIYVCKIRRAQAQHVLLGRCHFSRKVEMQNSEKNLFWRNADWRYELLIWQLYTTYIVLLLFYLLLTCLAFNHYQPEFVVIFFFFPLRLAIA